MPPNKSGRPAGRRPLPPSARTSPPRAAKPAPKKSARASLRPTPKTSRSQSGRQSARREAAGEVVLGNVPVASRVVGGLGIVAGLLLAISVLTPELDVAGHEVLVGDSVSATLVSWIWPLAVISAGTSVVLGQYPRLGLSALGVAGVLSVPGLLAQLYRASQAAERGRYEIIDGQRLLTSSVDVRAGWFIAVAALMLLILVGLAVRWVWPRIVMDDSGSLDPGRPLLACLAAVTGVIAVLSLAAALVGIPDEVSATQQVIAGQLRPVETVVPVEGAIGLLGRPGLALTSGLLLGAILVLYSMFASTLRPRLAVVGALGALTAYTAGLVAQALVEAASSDQIEVSIGGWGLALVALAYAALTLVAWRWHPVARPVSRGLPMRAASRRALRKG